MLYHFPTRDALVAGMVDKIIDDFETDIARHLPLAGSPESGTPGSFARAYVRATVEPADPDAPGACRLDRLGAALIAAAAAEPELLVPLQEAAGRWQARMVDDGLDPVLATVLRLACDGLWMCDLFGLAPPSGLPAQGGGRSAPRSMAEGPAMMHSRTRRLGRARRPSSVRLIRILTVTVFLQWLGATSIVPMLPVYIRRLGGSDLLAGLVMASFFAAGVLFQYPRGRVADRIGRRPVLVGGLVIYGIASLAFLAPIAPAMAILLRGLQGLGAGAAAVAALAMVSGAVAVERRGRAFASIYAGRARRHGRRPAHREPSSERTTCGSMFLGSGIVAFVACIPALRISEPPASRCAADARASAGRSPVPIARDRVAAGR